MHQIAFPEPLLAVAEQHAAQEGFKSTDEYIVELVRRGLEQHEADYYFRQAMAGDGNPSSITSASLAERKSEIEALLIEGLNSGPATEMTSENWAALRQRVDAKLAKQNGK